MTLKIKMTIETLVSRGLGRVVAGITPAPASRRVTFTNSPMERAQQVPAYSEKAVNELAKSRFPQLRDCDL
jgi:hypothetical protein